MKLLIVLLLIVTATLMGGCGMDPEPVPAGPDFRVAVERHLDGMSKGESDGYVLHAAARQPSDRAVASDLLTLELALEAAEHGQYAEMNQKLSRIQEAEIRLDIGLVVIDDEQRRIEDVACVVVGPQQGFDPGTQGDVRPASPVEEGRTLGRRAERQGVQEGTLLVHGPRSPGVGSPSHVSVRQHRRKPLRPATSQSVRVIA